MAASSPGGVDHCLPRNPFASDEVHRRFQPAGAGFLRPPSGDTECNLESQTMHGLGKLPVSPNHPRAMYTKAGGCKLKFCRELNVEIPSSDDNVRVMKNGGC